jgi:hypothetical protein
MPSRLPALALATTALAFFGCGPSKLNETKTWEMDGGDAKALDLPAVSRPQKINVEFNSSDADIYVYLFKEEDAKEDEGILGADAKKALDFKKGRSGSFSVDVEANTATRVIVRGVQGKTTVTLKVNNQ